MPLAVQLYVDPQTDSQFRRIWSLMEAQGLGVWIENIGTRPHLSLAVFDDDVPREPLLEITREFAAKLPCFHLNMVAVGVFPSERNVVFLSPVATPRLLRLHAEYHERLASRGLRAREIYRPDNWVPHCTAASRLRPEALSPTLELWRREYAFGLTDFVTLGVVHLPPVNELAEWPLA